MARREHRFGWMILLAALGTTGAVHGRGQKNGPARPEEPAPAWDAPGAGHRALDERVGEWSVKVRFFEAGKSPLGGSARSRQEWILDGHYLQETIEGVFGGAALRGRAVIAFDVRKNRYVQTWIDNFSTGIIVREGTYDATRRSMSLTGSAAVHGKADQVTTRVDARWLDDDRWIAEEYRVHPDGEEFKVTECLYTRETTVKNENPLRGKTLRWTFEDGPMANVTFEHDLREDGSIAWRAVGGPGMSGSESEYALVEMAQGVHVLSYRARSGHTLTVVLRMEEGRMFGVASNQSEWHPMKGSFEVVD